MTLFDPAVATEPRPVSLVKLSGELARAVAGVGRVSVEGEVVRPQLRPSGRVFFTLKDRAAQIDVAVPGNRARRCRVVHGERVRVTGAVGYFADRGRVSFTAEEVVPVGAGAIAALLQEVRGRLGADGLLDRPRRPLPVLPKVVGVVCGADAAVRADIESVVAARFPGYPVRFREVNVSGAGAAEAIAGGLGALLVDPDVEVVILARGGGDAAQLLPFSDEELCRAVCASRVPVVTAIGHERDRPLCDEVADLRCATPSLAANAVIPSRRDLEERLAGLMAQAGELAARSAAAAVARLDAADPLDALVEGSRTASSRLERAGGHLRLLDPSRRVVESLRLLERIDRESTVVHRLARARGQLHDRRHTLDALDPTRVLRRGYAVVRDRRGAVVRDAGAVGTGERLSAELARGRLTVEVTGVEG
ncbi:MAG TPA: exodeoxyribonuclease VII large subunit [Acidimicrobiales bacterium]|nr:exodeoxyribonuclease VII large subunit [Acidimicrobiales bacterium]